MATTQPAFKSVKRFGMCFMQCKDALFWLYDRLENKQTTILGAFGLSLFNLSLDLESTIFFGFAGLVASFSTCFSKKRPLLFLYLALLFGDAATTYWIANAHPLGVITLVGINGFLMAFALWFGFRSRNMLVRLGIGSKVSWISVIASWMAFEHLHEYWGLSFPWLHLGNTMLIGQNWFNGTNLLEHQEELYGCFLWLLSSFHLLNLW